MFYFFNNIIISTTEEERIFQNHFNDFFVFRALRSEDIASKKLTFQKYFRYKKILNTIYHFFI